MNPLKTTEPQQGFLIPDWPAPKNVRALCTTRVSLQGAQKAPRSLTGYEFFNLALHVNDVPNNVLENRRSLAAYLPVSESDIIWLEQVHGTKIINAGDMELTSKSNPIIADASFSQTTGKVCTVMTADCLPVLFCNLTSDKSQQQVAAAHAGWRGLADGILGKTLATFSQANNVIAWLGPAISQTQFEVGQEVFEAFTQKDPDNRRAFQPSQNTTESCPKWQADLYLLAKIELEKAGVKEIYGGDRCSFSEPDLFYSYRRDGSQSGRMASLIVME